MDAAVPDVDGDLDVVTSNPVVDLSREQIDPAPWRVHLNDGRGIFAEGTERVRGTVDRLLLGADGGGADR